jgi:hypothetical protein
MKRLLLSFAILVIPRLVYAANLGPLAELSWVGPALTGLSYAVGAGVVVWQGVKAISAYGNRDREGMGAVFEHVIICVVGGVLLGVIIPGLIAPIAAQGATL